MKRKYFGEGVLEVKRNILRKLTSVALCTTVLVGSAAGCTSGGTTEPSTEGGSVEAYGNDPMDTSLDNGNVKITIRSEANNHDVLKEMAESFKQKYAGQATFEFEYIDEPDADTKGAVLRDVHNAADIFFFADDQLSSMVAGGVLTAVPNQEEIKSANLEGAVEAASIDGTLYAYPMSADNGYFLYYNKAYYTEEDVQTLDRILEIAAENGKKFSMQWDSGWYLYSFFGNTGLEFGINDDGVTNYCNWNATEGDITGVDIVNALLDISSSPGFLYASDADFPTNVKDGTVIAGVSGVWNAVEIEEAWGDDYAAVKLPTYTCNGQQIQMASFVGYKMVGVNSYSEHLGWALKFADWITNEQNQELRFEKRGQGPSNTKAASSEAVAENPAIQAVIAQSEYGVLQRVGNNYWAPFETFGPTLAEGNPNNIDPQELIDALVAGITASTVG